MKSLVNGLTIFTVSMPIFLITVTTTDDEHQLKSSVALYLNKIPHSSFFYLRL